MNGDITNRKGFKKKVKLLLALTIVGCIIGFENNYSLGYMLNGISFEIIDFFLSIISIGALIIILKSKTKKTTSIVLIAELSYWLLKFYLYNTGFISKGCFGGISPLVFVYDFIVISMRLHLIILLFNKSILRIALPIIISFCAVFLKSEYFQFPYFAIIEYEQERKLATHQQGLLYGTFKGILKEKSTAVNRSIKVEFTSDSMFITGDDLLGLENRYRSFIQYPNLLELHRNRKFEHAYINQIDSLDFEFSIDLTSKDETLDLILHRQQ